MYAIILVIFISEGGNFILQGFDDMNSCQYVQSYINAHRYYHYKRKIQQVIATECTKERAA